VPKLVTSEWLAGRLGDSSLQVIDPRTRERYLSGHAAGAVHVPMREAFGGEGRIHDDRRLAEWLAGRGIASDRPVAVYDDFDFQKGSMVAWILEYLGHGDVSLLAAPFSSTWQAEGREYFYRPVHPDSARFAVAPRPELRATPDEASSGTMAILDVRSGEEYRRTEPVANEPVGHLPGAVNVPWRAFVRDQQDPFVGADEIARLLAEAGIADKRPIVVYCQSGPRAAVAFTAIRLVGRSAGLYDGSFLDWIRAGRPVEKGGS
jgi:thiosulfate/3-mercaptopyruvate sulfurtransferase